MKLFDAHTHLNHEMLFTDWEKHLNVFQSQGGQGLVNIGANADYNHNALLISQQAREQFPELRCKATLGIHPCDVENANPDVQAGLTELKTQILAHKDEVVAIGECGIDLFYPWTPETFELQQEYFRGQCELARELDLPIVIHSRSAFAETIEILQEYRDLKIYFHCRSYTEEEIQILVDLFPQIWIGFTGILTYPKSDAIRKSLLATPKSSILIETDAPYLSPQGFRGQTNEPQRIKEIWLFATEVLGIRENQLWEQVEENFWRLYR